MTDSFGQYGGPTPGPQQFGQQGPPGQGFPPQGYAPVKKRKKWPWVLLGVFMLLILLIGSCSFFVYRLAAGPIDATNTYVEALAEGDYPTAYAQVCDIDKEGTSLEEWQASAPTGITDYNFSSVQNNNGIVSVSGTIESNGVTEATTFTLVKEDDEWKICSPFNSLFDSFN